MLSYTINVVYQCFISSSIHVVYKSPEYDMLAYAMALDRLVEVGYPAVSDLCNHIWLCRQV